MHIKKKVFGIRSSGERVFLYTLKAGDLSLSVSTFGAALTALFVPSHRGVTDDILLGYEDCSSWLYNTPYFGVTVGRFANRIAHASFVLNGKQYTLEQNDGKNTLHSGRSGLNNKLWKACAYREKDGVFVRLEVKSPDGDGGFPGTVEASVTYGLTSSNELEITYDAFVDILCPLNLTNHAYFNLAGEGNGTVLSHEFILHASSYLELDNDHIPTGKIVPVDQSPFDFRSWKPISQDIDNTSGGYDHCFVVDGEPGLLRLCAEVYERTSGRTMRVFTTHPGVQFYTANFLNNVRGKVGSMYQKHSGFCLETQHFPDSPNHPEFPSSIYGPERRYRERSIFAFNVQT
ncbi:MAG: galactose mutarotase [Treponema sp.]|nr:galactose mutarotase [Treponema sp.]